MEPSKSATERREGRFLRRGVPIRLYQDTAEDHPQQDLLSDILKSRRDELGLKHREVAAKAGVSVSYVGMVERGDRRPTIPNLKAILDALELPNDGHGPRAVEFDYGDGGFLVLFKPVNPVARLNPGMRFTASKDPGRAEERLVADRDMLGKLLRTFSNNTAAVKVVYRFHCSGDPELADDELPDPDVMLGELAQVLMGSPALARQIYEQYFGEAAQAFLGT